MTGGADLCSDSLALSRVSICNGVLLKICLDHKFQWPQACLNCESFVCEGHKA